MKVNRIIILAKGGRITGTIVVPQQYGTTPPRWRGITTIASGSTKSAVELPIKTVMTWLQYVSLVIPDIIVFVQDSIIVVWTSKQLSDTSALLAPPFKVLLGQEELKENVQEAYQIAHQSLLNEIETMANDVTTKPSHARLGPHTKNEISFQQLSLDW